MYRCTTQEAWRQRRKLKKTVKKDHWLDYAEERYGKVFVADVKAVLRVCVLFLLYPLFWALYDQQASISVYYCGASSTQ